MRLPSIREGQGGGRCSSSLSSRIQREEARTGKTEVDMFSVKKDISGFVSLQKKLEGLKKQIPRAAAAALNETGDQVVAVLREQMAKDFDRPTPYTLNSLTHTRATTENLSVTIHPRDYAGKGTPAKNYLKPEIFGGDRNQKRSEMALQLKGILPRGMYAYPGAGANKDAYGNMPGSQYVQIISYFQAFGVHGHRANMDAKGRARLLKGSKKRGFGFEYFAVRKQHGGLVPGIWKRTSFGAMGKAVSPILIFGKKPTYTRRYRWNETARVTAMNKWPINFQKAMALNVSK